MNRNPHSLGPRLLLWASICILSSTAVAAGISIENASVRLINDLYVVEAKMNYQLSDKVLEALNNGIPLTFIIEVEFRQQRKYLWDPKVVAARQGYRLEHHALSDQYSVVNLATGMRQNFPSLQEATIALGRVEQIPVIEQRRLNPTHTYRARIRARLDIETLPPPLRPVAYFSSQWQISSRWYSWEVRP